MKPLTAKIVYKPAGFGLSLAAGAVASLVTRRLWLVLTDRDSLPDADDTSASWPELLVGAGLEAAVFAVAKTTAQRLEATGIRRAVSSPSIRRRTS
ncbi:hypothetical protein ABH926_004397 [Catenulispora sp. GP43]|uniref:DUF4235 domain-containing protein n=1 Tax=Catenulispora sp. GP43 TaxID=3156263 RepID=UPI003517DEA2